MSLIKTLMKETNSDPEIPIVILPPEDGSIKRFLPEIRSKFRLKETFAALRHPNYRLWFWGQMISLFGSWMQVTALAYFVFELTHSPAFLGYVGFAGGVPAWIFSFYAGAVADRFERKKILIYTQAGMMLLSVFLAVLTFTNIILPWHIILIAAGMGIMNSFDAPSRHAFVNELVSKDNLVNAIALNSTMFNIATSVGPAFGGIIYAILGPGWCFIINSISFLAVIFGLLKMKLTPFHKGKKLQLHSIRNKRRFQILIQSKIYSNVRPHNVYAKYVWNGSCYFISGMGG